MGRKGVWIMRKQRRTMKQLLLASCLLLMTILCGCSQESAEMVQEVAGNGYFRDVDFHMTIDEVIAAEEEREDSGAPEKYEQYSALMYDGITWDGYTCNLSYIFDADGIHLDTILVEVLSGFDFERSKQTIIELYTDGSEPEESTSEYFTWSSGERVVLVQNNADGSGVIVMMLIPDAVPAE
jgi:hypothetical protein